MIGSRWQPAVTLRSAKHRAGTGPANARIYSAALSAFFRLQANAYTLGKLG